MEESERREGETTREGENESGKEERKPEETVGGRRGARARTKEGRMRTAGQGRREVGGGKGGEKQKKGRGGASPCGQIDV